METDNSERDVTVLAVPSTIPARNLCPTGEHRCNIWQGELSEHNTGDDGYLGTVFEPNGYDLYNIAGNVWEWCADWFDARYNIIDVYSYKTRLSRRREPARNSDGRPSTGLAVRYQASPANTPEPTATINP